MLMDNDNSSPTTPGETKRKSFASSIISDDALLGTAEAQPASVAEPAAEPVERPVEQSTEQSLAESANEQLSVAELAAESTVEPSAETQPTEPALDPAVAEFAASATELDMEPDKPIAAVTTADVQKKKSKAPLLAAIVILLLVCGGAAGFFLLKDKLFAGQNNANKKGQDNATVSELRMEGNSLSDFDIAFLKKNNTEKNKVYSPLSIKYALKMLSDGTAGETKAEIDNLIGDYTAKNYQNSKNRSLANALFVRSNYKGQILDSYIDGLKKNYSADVVFDDFANANTINKWVSDKTLGIINNLLNDGDVDNMNYALINALAIDMDWTTRLQCGQDGTGASDEIIEHPIESRSYSISYAHEEYYDNIHCIENKKFDTASFNDSKIVQVASIGASINKYDIVKELGEDKIRSTVKPKYEAWLKEQPKSRNDLDAYPADVDVYLDKYIDEIKGGYGSVADSTDFKMYADDDVKVFAKDLKTYDGTTLQYVGIMPKTQKLTDYVENASASGLSETIDKLYDVKKENFKEGVITNVIGTIPFFKYDYDMADFMKNLKELGVSKVFEEGVADLSGLTKEENAYIGTAAHKADIEFSNDGIKAAAVTFFGGLGDNSGFDYRFKVPVETIDMSFNKPYMYLIRDKQSGEVWFAGTVYEPTEKQD